MSFLDRTIEAADSIFGSIPFARIIYSLVLAALLVLIGRELLSVWDRGKYFLGDFSYFEAGVKKADYGDQLRNETILDYGMVLDLIKRYPPKVDPGDQPDPDDCVSPTWWKQITSDVTARLQAIGTAIVRSAKAALAKLTGKPATDDDEGSADSDICSARSSTSQPTFKPAAIDQILGNLQTQKLDNVAGRLDVTVQGISLKALLSAFGNLVYPTNTEITASIYAATAPNKARRTVLSVSGASQPTLRGQNPSSIPRVFTAEADIDDAEDAFRIACFLIWAQWPAQNDPNTDDPKRVAYDELCNWGRILTIKDVMATSTKYNLDARKKAVNLEFLKTQYALATQLDIGMHEIYASLAGMEQFVGDQKVSLSGGAEASINSLADIMRYLAFTKATSSAKNDRDGDWTAGVPKQEATRKDVNRSFFQSMIRTDCKADEAMNVVRISRPTFNRKTSTTSSLITSGFVLSDGNIISVAPGPQDPNRLVPFLAAEVTAITCDGAQTYKVTAAEYLDKKGGTPLIHLTVPDLKRKGDKTRIDFTGLSTGRTAIVAGFIRDTDLTFATRKELSNSETSVINNNDIFTISGRAVTRYYDDFAEDREQRFYLSSPFGAGLSGAPILGPSGTLRGFVESGTFVGQNLSLGIGLALTTLKRNELLAPFVDDD